jgi:cadmium resistance protein CadD (predicted permease)
MEQILYLTGLGIAAFVSTNIDDFFITTTFFMDTRYSIREVILGKYLGLIFLVAVSCIGYFFKLVIPIQWIGLMGFLPIMIGSRHLMMMRKAKRERVKVISYEDTEKDSFQPERAKRTDGILDAEKKMGKSGVMLVMLITFANGGDNIGVYMPLFDSLALDELITVILVFFVMLAVFCATAYYFTSSKYISSIFRKYGEPGYPYILIFLGIYIFIKCETYTLLQL